MNEYPSKIVIEKRYVVSISQSGINDPETNELINDFEKKHRFEQKHGLEWKRSSEGLYSLSDNLGNQPFTHKRVALMTPYSSLTQAGQGNGWRLRFVNPNLVLLEVFQADGTLRDGLVVNSVLGISVFDDMEVE